MVSPSEVLLLTALFAVHGVAQPLGDGGAELDIHALMMSGAAPSIGETSQQPSGSDSFDPAAMASSDSGDSFDPAAMVGSGGGDSFDPAMASGAAHFTSPGDFGHFDAAAFAMAGAPPAADAETTDGVTQDDVAWMMNAGQDVNMDQSPVNTPTATSHAEPTFEDQLKALMDDDPTTFGAYDDTGVIGGGTCMGGYVKDLDLYLDCKKMVGFLAIVNSANSNLDKLAQLQAILKQDGVSGPGGNGLLVANNSALTNLDGLTNLNLVAGGMTIEGNPNLESLDGLGHNQLQVGVNSAGNSLEVSNNPSLAELGTWDPWKGGMPGSLTLQENMILQQINGFNGIQTLGGGVRIAFNEKLQDISGLSKLNSVGKDVQGKSVVVVNNRNLHDVTGLRGLQGLLAGAVHVAENAQLRTLDGLDQVLGIGFDDEGVSLNITNNEQLHSIEGLAGIKGRLNGSVVVMMNPSLKVLSGLQQISELGADNSGDSLVIKANAILRDMLGFKGLTKTDGAVTVSDNEHLDSLDGLQGLNEINGVNLAGNSLEVKMNQELTQIKGLRGLNGHLKGALIVDSNAQLQSLEGLCSVEAIDAANQNGAGLEIVNNTQLTELDCLKRLKEIYGDVTVKGNFKLQNVVGLDMGLQHVGSVSISDVECVSEEDVDMFKQAGAPATEQIATTGPQSCRTGGRLASITAVGVGEQDICGSISPSLQYNAEEVQLKTAEKMWDVWQVHGSSGLFIDVDTSRCAFTAERLNYITSIVGESAHWQLVGVNSVYRSDAKSFRIYLWHPVLRGKFMMYFAQRYRWRVSWAADQGRTSGATIAGTTGWRALQGTRNVLYVDVDTSKSLLSPSPRYVAALHGNDNHWRVQGAHSIYEPSNTGFRVFIVYPAAITPAEAEGFAWRLAWIASNDDIVSGTSLNEWTKYENPNGNETAALTITVDTSRGHFETAMPYLSSISGRSHHWMVTGAASIYGPQKDEFRIYLDKAQSAEFAKAHDWRVNYVAVDERNMRRIVRSGCRLTGIDKATFEGSTPRYPDSMQASFINAIAMTEHTGGVKAKPRDIKIVSVQESCSGRRLAGNPFGYAAAFGSGLSDPPAWQLLQNSGGGSDSFDHADMANGGDGSSFDPTAMASMGGGDSFDPTAMASSGSGDSIDPAAMTSGGFSDSLDPAALANGGDGSSFDPTAMASMGGGDSFDPAAMASGGGGDSFDHTAVASSGSGGSFDPAALAMSGNGGNAGSEGFGAVTMANSGDPIGDVQHAYDGAAFASSSTSASHNAVTTASAGNTINDVAMTASGAPGSAGGVNSRPDCKLDIKFTIEVNDPMGAIAASTGLASYSPDQFIKDLQHELALQDKTDSSPVAMTVSPFDAGTTTTAPHKPYDCVLTPWVPATPLRDAACSKTCGGGIRERRRAVIAPAIWGGAPCDEKRYESEPCNEHFCVEDCKVSQWSSWGFCRGNTVLWGGGSCGQGFRTRSRDQTSPASFGGRACPVLEEKQHCDAGSCPVHCKVSQWGAWGACSATCAGGTRIRTRRITKHAEQGGYECPNLAESDTCKTQHCPIDCVTSDWQAWSGCSATCGWGIEKKIRPVLVHARNGGKPCGAVQHFRPCHAGYCPIGCATSGWSWWSECTKSCGGGTQTKVRSVMVHARHGGAVCPELIQGRDCNVAPCARDCVVDNWGSWSSCTNSCGGGVRVRTRTASQTPEHGGKTCPVLEQREMCNPQECPVDCTLSAWSGWSTCSKTCGGGKRTRTRFVTSGAAFGGAACPHDTTQFELCSSVPCTCIITDASEWGDCSQSCGTGTQTRVVARRQAVQGVGDCSSTEETQVCNIRVCPVDCVQPTWGSWGACSRSCGSGTQHRTRHPTTYAAFGGKSCAPSTEQRFCNVAPCPVDCVMTPFDNWTPCPVDCGSGMQSRQRGIATQAAFGGSACGALQESRPCGTQPCPLDCQVSTWSDWDACSVSCGTGSQFRTRLVTQASAHGGKRCPTLSDSQQCHRGCCPGSSGPPGFCRACAAGRYMAHSAEPFCLVCPSGKFADEQGSVACKKCDKGRFGFSYHDTGSKAHCMECPAGKFQEFDGSTHCVECESGQYVNLAGYPQCLKCPLGQWTKGKAGQPSCDWPSVVCKVTDFGQWKGCTKSCGGGVNERERKATHEMVYYGPYKPHFSATVEQLDATGDSQHALHWSPWGGWSECSKPCGGGMKTRVRTCLKAGGGCEGMSSTMDACNTQECTINQVAAQASVQQYLPADMIGAIAGLAGGVDGDTSGGAGAGAGMGAGAGADSGLSGSLGGGIDHGSGFDAAMLAAMMGGGGDGGSIFPADANMDEQLVASTTAPSDAPVITILGKNPVRVEESDSGDYQDMSAVCQDRRDGDISNHLEIKGTVINMAKPGTYRITYKCANSRGTRAMTKHRIVIVLPHPSKEPKLCPHPNPNCVPARPGCSYVKSNATSHGCPRYPCGELVCTATLANCPTLIEEYPCNAKACPRDCDVSDWSSWSTCTQSCGTGHRHRAKTILVPAAHGGKLCPTTFEAQQCNTHACPVDCALTPWNAWSNCTKTCGGGTQERFRSIDRDSMHGGVPCGHTKETRGCHLQACPIDCTVSSWGSFSACSQSCGFGARTRVRNITEDASSGGVACPALTHTEDCEGYRCTRDCAVSDWSSWSMCSRSCGTGTNQRSRSVVHAAEWGGMACGELEQEKTCNHERCPVDCVVGPWDYPEWSSATCSVSCGLHGGLKVRTRVNEAAQYGGVACPHERETQVCNAHPCPVDCVVTHPIDTDTHWPWSGCSVSCGQGTDTRSRSILVPAAHGGVACPANLFEERYCNHGECPIHCVVSEWTQWGTCSKSCRDENSAGRKTRTRHVITPAFDGGFTAFQCPALEDRVDCNTHPCPVDCTVGGWGTWATCASTCGNTVPQKRTRKLTAAQHGGLVCPHAEESRDCNTQCCPVDCKTTAWTPWSHCSVTCGDGSQWRMRQRTVNSTCGGLECGELYQQRACNSGVCPVHCETTEWTSWGSCSKSCGSGSQQRAREIIKQPNAVGIQCPSLVESRQCNNQFCPVDCSVGDWGSWEAFQGGGSTVERTRPVTAQMQHGGTACPITRQTTHWHGLHPDCLSPPNRLGSWSSCSADCGTGLRHRERMHVICSHSAVVKLKLSWTMSERCNEHPCSASGAGSASRHGRRLQGSNWAGITQGEALALLGEDDLKALPQQPGMHGKWQRWQGNFFQ